MARKKKKLLFPQCPLCNQKMRIAIDPKEVAKYIQKMDDGSFYLVVHAHGDLDEDAHAVIVEVDVNLDIRGQNPSDMFEYTYDI